MLLINFEINIFFNFVWKMYYRTWDYGNREPKFAIADTKLYVPMVTLSAQDNEKLLQQLKAVFKRVIN